MKNLLEYLKKNNHNISFCESFTGGLLSSTFVSNPGVSKYLNESYVTYSNESKERILGVTSHTLSIKGAVSEECAIEMAEGLKVKTNAHICISTTGIAGPTGDSPNKPIGLTYFCVIIGKHKHTFKKVFSNLSRTEVMNHATKYIFNEIETIISK